jgi:hypothetical protein
MNITRFLPHSFQGWVGQIMILGIIAFCIWKIIVDRSWVAAISLLLIIAFLTSMIVRDVLDFMERDRHYPRWYNEWMVSEVVENTIWHMEGKPDTGETEW